MNKTFFGISVVLFTMAFTFPAFGLNLTWHLQDVMFENGATADGSFDYDRTTDTYSNIMIMTTTPNTYTFENPNAFNPSGPDRLSALTDNTPNGNDPILVLLFSSPLTDAGGTVDIDTTQMTSREGECNMGGGGFPACAGTQGGTSILVTKGVVTTAPIPEPSTMILFGTGLAGLGFWRYRKQKTA